MVPNILIVKTETLKNKFMAAAQKVSLDQPFSNQRFYVGCVVVKDNAVIGLANNYNPYHIEHGCERRKLNIPSGQDFHLCPGCDPETHCEPRAIQNALQNGHDTTGAAVYMYGHYYACADCQKAMTRNGIREYYMMQSAKNIFS